MRAIFTDEQQALSDTVRDLAAKGREDARAMLDGGEPSPHITDALFGGFNGLGIPEESGGLGGGLVEAAIVVEALGRTVTPTPFVSHLLALHAGYGAGLDISRALDGSQLWALAADEPGPVRDGMGCSAAVVGLPGSQLGVAEPVSRSPRTALDPTRPLADLEVGTPSTAGNPGAQPALLRPTAILSAEQVGVGRGALGLAVEFAKAREQFGQPVGRFQAVAHQLAESFAALESAWSLVLYACWAVDAGEPAAGAAVHRAKAKAGQAAIFAAERATQVHGGIGITWEADLHLYLRRALADDAWLGSARYHHRTLGALLLSATPATFLG